MTQKLLTQESFLPRVFKRQSSKKKKSNRQQETLTPFCKEKKRESPVGLKGHLVPYRHKLVVF